MILEDVLKEAKKRITDKQTYRIVFILIIILSFFWGNFLDNSVMIKRINPITMFYGLESASIDSVYSKEDFSNKITLKIFNDGDKDINNLYVNYNFCNKGNQSAFISEPKLYINEKQYFTIDNVFLNKSCSPSTIPTSFDIFFDENDNCYANVTDQPSKVCSFCQIKFYVYGNNKKISAPVLSYPYSEKYVSSLELLKKYENLNVTLNPKPETGHKPFALSTCRLITSTTNMSKLKEFSPISFTFFDPYTYCHQLKDPEWCAQYFTEFEK